MEETKRIFILIGKIVLFIPVYILMLLIIQIIKCDTLSTFAIITGIICPVIFLFFNGRQSRIIALIIAIIIGLVERFGFIAVIPGIVATLLGIQIYSVLSDKQEYNIQKNGIKKVFQGLLKEQEYHMDDKREENVIVMDDRIPWEAHPFLNPFCKYSYHPETGWFMIESLYSHNKDGSGNWMNSDNYDASLAIHVKRHSSLLQCIFRLCNVSCYMPLISHSNKKEFVCMKNIPIDKGKRIVRILIIKSKDNHNGRVL